MIFDDLGWSLMIFRNHDIPSLVNEQRIRKIFNRFKFNPESKHEAISSKDIHRFLLETKYQSLKKFLSISILKKMKKANYGLTVLPAPLQKNCV